jgi:hypothetical protein
MIVLAGVTAITLKDVNAKNDIRKASTRLLNQKKFERNIKKSFETDPTCKARMYVSKNRPGHCSVVTIGWKWEGLVTGQLLVQSGIFPTIAQVIIDL